MIRTDLHEEGDIRRHWFALFAVGSAVVLNALTWALLLWKIPYSSEPILLHYNVYFGIDLTGPWAQMFWIPGSGLLIAVVHTVVVWFVTLQHQLSAWVLLVMSVVIQIIALLASLLVVLLNSSL